MRLKGKDILLLLLYAKGKTGKLCEPIAGTTRLTKTMFLFEEEVKSYFDNHDLENLPEFIPWNYGPWSKDLLDYVEFFEGIRFIDVTLYRPAEDISVAEVKEPELWAEEMVVDDKETEDAIRAEANKDMFEQKQYALTETGKKYVETKLIPNLSPEQIEILDRFKKRISSISLYALLRYVYSNYNKSEANWIKNSVIKDRFA
jgi:hypothetical protein